MQRCLVYSSILSSGLLHIFLPCDLFLNLKSLFFFFFFPPRREKGKCLLSVFWFCYIGNAAVRSRVFPGNCFDFAGQHGGFIAAFATGLEGFSKGDCCFILVVDRPEFSSCFFCFGLFFFAKFTVLSRCWLQPFPPDIRVVPESHTKPCMCLDTQRRSTRARRMRVPTAWDTAASGSLQSSCASLPFGVGVDGCEGNTSWIFSIFPPSRWCR